MNFSSFDLKPELLEGIEAMGFEKPTPIQEEAIPIILEGKDMIGCAQTGTGKTGAFVIPLINQFSGSTENHIKCIIIVPTRELAMQIDQQIDGFSYFCSATSYSIYGGNQPGEFDQQKRSIQQGADILIATPGRLLSHLNLGYVKLDQLETLVLDEADRMLDMGFISDIEKIIGHLPGKRQTLMFSATMAPDIRKLAAKILKDPKEVSFSISKPAEGVDQQAYLVYNDNKVPLLVNLLKGQEIQNMIIFASTKASVNNIEKALRAAGLDVSSMHSDKSQEERNETMLKFKSGAFKVLVATDILSRGIDIDNLSHVLNYDIPKDAADYVHRVGRTARAEKEGKAISFINPYDQQYFAGIEKLIGYAIEKKSTPEFIGKTPTYSPNSNKRPKRFGNRHNGKGGGQRNHKNRKPHHKKRNQGNNPNQNRGNNNSNG